MTPSPCSPAGSSRGWTRRRPHPPGPELARDAVQEGFIGAWRNLPTLRDADRFEAWLHRLVFRACIDVIRRRGRRPMEVELMPIDGPAIVDPGHPDRHRQVTTPSCAR
jgi:DNA-directed RNA polymerase specialized sigma24 family protein